jgi:serine/threonine protein kinase
MKKHLTHLEIYRPVIKQQPDMEQQTFPDFFYEKPDEVMSRTTTNPRYKFFRQNYFTAGDYEQFLEHWDGSPDTLTTVDRKKVSRKMIDRLPMAKIQWSKYSNPCLHDVFHTYFYISDKFKKGVFVRFRDGHMTTFLPFSKVNFQNEWSEKISVCRKKYTSVLHMMKKIAERENRPFVESRIHKDMKCWYGNNGLVRLEFPISEGDSGLNMLKDMLTCYTQERQVSPCSFFLNKRDFPLLTLDGTESYSSFFGEQTPLLSHNYAKYVPILGMTTTELHADIPIPTWEDWCRVGYWKDRRMFAKEFRIFPFPEEFDALQWENKKPIAVFRGASTGLGTTLENNPRLFFSMLSAQKKTDPRDGVPYLDVGITKWNLRPRKHPQSPYLETIELSELSLPLVEYMSSLEQAQHKYILHLPGHSAAYRLSLEMYYGSVILLYPCRYELWFSKWLKPWVHYVPIDADDPDDIFKKIDWCKDNDVKCKKIAHNARHFAHKYLSREGMFSYLDAVFESLQKNKCIVEYSGQRIDVCLQKFLSKALHIEKRVSFTEHISPDMMNLFSTRPRDFFQVWTQYCPTWRQEIETTCVVQTRNTTVSSFEWNTLSLVVKESKKQWKKNFCHEYAFFRFYGNTFAHCLPHFPSVLAFEDLENETRLVMDHVKGKTFDVFLKDTSTTLEDVLFVWVQLCLALEYAQQQCAFFHMDLFPWNIIVRETTIPLDTHYSFPDGTSFYCQSTCIPVMIDFEKSHFMLDGIHCYNTSPFQYCRIHDIISVVFSSLALFLEHHVVNSSHLSVILSIMKFFSSPYTHNQHFQSLSHVRSFLKRHRKFSNIMLDKKQGLEHVTILSFLKHILKLCKSFRHGKISASSVQKTAVWNPHYWTEQSLYIQLDSIICSIRDAEKSMIEKTFQQFWLNVEKQWTSSQKQHPVSFLFYRIMRERCLRRLQHKFEELEKYFSIKIWRHLHFQDFFQDATQSFVQEIRHLWTRYSSLLLYRSRSSPYVDCPDLMTHPCRQCHVPKVSVPTVDISVRETQELLFMVSEYCHDVSFKDIDFFRLWYHGFPQPFAQFVQNCLSLPESPEV